MDDSHNTGPQEHRAMGSLDRQGRLGDGMLACCSAGGSLPEHGAVPRVAQPAWRAWAMGHGPSGSGVDGSPTGAGMPPAA